ncbi:MAG: hypothetical protein D6702_05830, partial [Planctomycetota bacterium]
SWPPGRADEIRELARRDRARRAWIRSSRCLRDCSDFVAETATARRRGFAPPAAGDGVVLARGRRSRVVRLGPVVAKHYLRAGAPAGLRRLLPALRPAARAFRRLHLLELEGLPAARPLAWTGDVVWTSWVEGREAAASDLPALAAWLRRLHDRGHGLRDAKAANFRMTSDGPVLIDADGITPARLRPARDLGRLAAEAGDADCLEALLAAYGRHEEAAVERWRLRFRRLLAAAPGG